MRVIGEAGENLGVLRTEEAIQIAKEKGLDLVEIAATAKPPVVRIISYDKFRYLRGKEERKQRQIQKVKDLKHVRITPRAALNDLQTKANQADKFLNAGYRVEINLFLRGREKANKDWGLKKLNEFLGMIKTAHEIAVAVKPGMRGGFTAQIIKK